MGLRTISLFLGSNFAKKILAVILLLLTAFTLNAKDNRLGIMDLVAKKPISKNDASILTDFIFDAVYKYGRSEYAIISRSDRERLLKEHEFSQSDLCDSIECALEIGRYLSADYIIVGSFTKFGSNYHVSMRIVNVNTTEVEGSARYKASNYDGIEQSVNDCVKELFGISSGPTPDTPESRPSQPKPDYLWKGTLKIVDDSDPKQEINLKGIDYEIIIWKWGYPGTSLFFRKSQRTFGERLKDSFSEDYTHYLEYGAFNWWNDTIELCGFKIKLQKHKDDTVTVTIYE